MFSREKGVQGWYDIRVGQMMLRPRKAIPPTDEQMSTIVYPRVSLKDAFGSGGFASGI